MVTFKTTLDLTSALFLQGKTSLFSNRLIRSSSILQELGKTIPGQRVMRFVLEKSSFTPNTPVLMHTEWACNCEPLILACFCSQANFANHPSTPKNVACCKSIKIDWEKVTCFERPQSLGDAILVAPFSALSAFDLIPHLLFRLCKSTDIEQQNIIIRYHETEDNINGFFLFKRCVFFVRETRLEYLRSHYLNKNDIIFWHCTRIALCPLLLPGSISPTFYKQLLRSQILKAQKSCLIWWSFLRFWDLRA